MVMTKVNCHGLVRGEGEPAVLQIMHNIDLGLQPLDKTVPGAVFRNPKTGELIFNKIIRIDNLDKLPFPAYHLLPPLNVYKSRSRKSPVAAIVTSRGCLFKCSFCSKDIFKNKVTFRSPDNVLSEIDYLVQNFGVRQIDILDDNFALKKNRLEEILNGLINRNYGLAINLQSGIRSEIIDESLLNKMKKAGIFKIAFGVESADKNVLRLCRKKLDLNKIVSAASLAKQKGFLTYGFFIIGLPGETDEGFERTLDFARRVNFDIANFCIATPFVGTELYRQVQENGNGNA